MSSIGCSSDANDEPGRRSPSTPFAFLGTLGWLFLSLAAISSPAHAGFVLLIEHDETMSLVLRDISEDGSVMAGEVSTPSGRSSALWSPLDGAQIFDLAPGVDDSFLSVSADGTRLLTHVPGGVPYGQIWTAGVGVVASAPSLPPAPDPSGVFMSSDGTTLLMRQTVSGTGGDPDVQWVWRWSALDGYTQIGVGTPRAIAADGSVVLLDAEVAPGAVETARWTSASGVVAVPGLAGVTKPRFSDMSADGAVIVGGEDVASGLDPAIVWSEAEGLSVVGAPADGGFPIFSRFERVTPDGVKAVGLFQSLSPPAYDQLVQPMTWSVADGFTIVHDELRRQGIDFQGIEVIFIMAVSEDGDRFVGVGYSPTLGVPFYTLIYDVDPEHPPTQGAQIEAGAGSSHSLLGWPFATGGLWVGMGDVDVAGRLVTTYRSLPPVELAGTLPGTGDLLTLIGSPPRVTSWAFEFDGALAPGAAVGMTFEVPNSLKDALDDEGALQLLVHDGTSWQPHAWEAPYGRLTASFDSVPEAVVLVPTQAPVPIGSLVAPWLFGSLVALAFFRLRHERMRSEA